jgi:hypothetical protein
MDNNCTFKLINKYKRKKPKTFKEALNKNVFSFKCVKLDVLFIVESCELQKKEYNPLSKLMAHNEFMIIHFVNVVSNKLIIDVLPNPINDFLNEKNE